jgi:hypothetical protein
VVWVDEMLQAGMGSWGHQEGDEPLVRLLNALEK